MDKEPYRTISAALPHDHVEISDYPGVPNVPPLATPAPQRGIKQVEGDSAAPASHNSPLGGLDRRWSHFSFASLDGKLVLTKSKWRSLLDRYYFSFFTIWMAFSLYGQMQNAAFNGRQTAEFPDIINALLTRPSADLVTSSTIFALSLAVTALYVWRMIKFLRGPADYFAFDRAAGSFTSNESANAPISLRDIYEVNVDWQDGRYQVSLKTTEGGKIKIDSWYNEAEARYTAGVIANYIGVPVTRTETLVSAAKRRIAAAAAIILLLIFLLVTWWWNGLIHGLHL